MKCSDAFQMWSYFVNAVQCYWWKLLHMPDNRIEYNSIRTNQIILPSITILQSLSAPYAVFMHVSRILSAHSHAFAVQLSHLFNGFIFFSSHLCLSSFYLIRRRFFQSRVEKTTNDGTFRLPPKNIYVQNECYK